MVTETDNISLPELSDEDKEFANSHDGKLFALDLLNPESIGFFSWIKGLGVALQNIGNNKVRCICIYDDPPAYKHLAMIEASLKSVGGILEFGECTIRRDWDPESIRADAEENRPPEPSGMEVAWYRIAGLIRVGLHEII